MSSLIANWQAVQGRIANAAEKAGRVPGSVRLLAVSKTCPPEAVIEAARAGQQAFGENYEQEALEKMQAIQQCAPELRLEWHFIGPIQSNKTRRIAAAFDWVHSVDREKIARRLSEQRPAGLPPLNVCLQVNISRENSKSGTDETELFALAKTVSSLPGLKLRGLMAIPEPQADEARQRQPFRQLKTLYDKLRKEGYPLDTLSMGMTADMDAAIAEGATIVRIGTAIFGPRN
ncbi:MAG: YggS family pyridoxal phosphate-dependent enzyme [Alistipes senegalensis]|nr:YggS family pyridoxal phosphate-dependent enzyme [Oxalobacter formigenes]MCM1280377.1 YggS family pyridoxal phosphate-dependent enzyme [Alistipes senegalensis]